MADERVVDKIITKFFIDTCLVRPTSPMRNTVLGTILGGIVSSSSLKYSKEAECIPLTTGSVAEFYIEPMLPCIGDIDIMFFDNAIVAVPEGQQPPANLPEEFLHYVEVVEIVDSHVPGYVYLRLQYISAKCRDDGRYSAMKNDIEQYMVNYPMITGDDKYDYHGPAILIILGTLCTTLVVAATSHRLANTTQKQRLARLRNC